MLNLHYQGNLILISDLRGLAVCRCICKLCDFGVGEYHLQGGGQQCCSIFHNAHVHKVFWVY